MTKRDPSKNGTRTKRDGRLGQSGAQGHVRALKAANPSISDDAADPRMSDLERVLLNRIDLAGLPVPEREVRFHPKRRWRFDFAYPLLKLGIEVEGGIWSGGRHTRGRGFEEDCVKYGEAAVLGWTVLRVTGDMIEDGRAVDLIRRALEER